MTFDLVSNKDLADLTDLSDGDIDISDCVLDFFFCIKNKVILILFLMFLLGLLFSILSIDF